MTKVKSSKRPRQRGNGGAKGPLLAPNRNCWRIVEAERFAVIVDAERYFRELRRAMIAAEGSIMMIGWDFDLRIDLDRGAKRDWPRKLGRLIEALIKRKPDLEVRLLKWDLGVVKTLGRGSTPLFMLDWLTDKRITLKLDGAHPAAACHHQKIVVIDDALAFCGGIDVTVGRWDTRQHRGRDKRRVSPWGFAQEPWHDATAAVSGEAAVALGELARDRWRRATGEKLAPSRSRRDHWPVALTPLLSGAAIAIARTAPRHRSQRQVREIETLYLDMIAAARHSIYVETQYFASQAVAEALAKRLRQKNGPEIVVVNPRTAEGWLEETVMGPARAIILAGLADVDRDKRFRIYCPVAAGGTPIYVHAKIMIVDDRLLKIGSSNLNNRSMGLDTECDLAIEVVPGRTDAAATAKAIAALRADLLAEHLGGKPADVARVLRRTGSLIATIERLTKPRGRRLVAFVPPVFGAAELSLAQSRLLDPERPRALKPRLKRFVAGWAAGGEKNPARRTNRKAEG